MANFFENQSALIEWQKERMRLFHTKVQGYPEPVVENVTILAYFYSLEHNSDEFFRVECAIRETWNQIGMLHTVLVVNKNFEIVDLFAQKFANVEIQVESSLVPGSTRPLSLDCICRLHTRFSTEYVLIVQNDGFPLYGGKAFAKFVGPWDYIGGPWGGRLSYFDFFPYPGYAVGNGGFSLRSRRICRAAAEHWRGIVRLIVPYTNWFYEDIYYTRALSVFVRGWRKMFNIAPFDVAREFSLANKLPYPSKIPPMGFHSPDGFVEYMKLYGREVGLSHEGI